MVSAFPNDLRPSRYDVVSPSGDIIGYAIRGSRVNNADSWERENYPWETAVVADTLDAGLVEAFNAGRGALVKIWVLHLYADGLGHRCGADIDWDNDESFHFKYIKSIRNFLKNGTT